MDEATTTQKQTFEPGTRVRYAHPDLPVMTGTLIAGAVRWGEDDLMFVPDAHFVRVLADMGIVDAAAGLFTASRGDAHVTITALLRPSAPPPGRKFGRRCKARPGPDTLICTRRRTWER